MQPQYDRIKVADFGRKQSAKANGAAKRYANSKPSSVANNKNSDIIKLPRYQEAVIPEAKFTQYALNPIKDPNKAKAFKDALGYDQTNYAELIANIRNHILASNAIKKPDNGHGGRYEVTMELTGVNGKKANVLTAWIDDKETGEMRLTSAYIKKRKKER